MMSNKIPLETVHEVRQRCLCLAAQRAARALARRFDRAFAPLGLTNGQFSLMMPLNAPRQMKMAELADLLAMDRTTLTAALKALERRGLVSIAPDKNDRRARTLKLTSAGRDTLRKAVMIWRAEHAVLETELSDTSAATLRRLLPDLAEAGQANA